MAKLEKNVLPPVLSLIMKAFSADSEEELNSLVMEAGKFLFSRVLSKKETQGIIHLIQATKPIHFNDFIDAAQFVVSHILGMHKLASVYSEDQKLGLKLLRYSNKIMQKLKG